MFTLGNKEAIVNTTNQYQISTSGNLLTLAGFGTFDGLNLTSLEAQRAQTRQLDQLSFACPSATALGIAALATGVAVVVHLRVNSLRQASESAIDFIKRGRPMILEIKVNGSDSAATVAATTLAAFNEYKNKFLNITLPITAMLDPADGTFASILLTATEGYYQINDNVSFLKRGEIFAVDAVTTRAFDTTLVVNDPAIAPGNTTLILDSVAGLTVNDTIRITPDGIAFSIDLVITEIVVLTNTITFSPPLPNPVGFVTTDMIYKVQKGVEAVNDGKYLEENVRMSTPFTSDAYAIKPAEVPILDAKYAMVSFEIDASLNPGTTGWAAHKTGDIKSKEYDKNRYTLYYLETVALLAEAKKILDWAIALGGTSCTLADCKKANGGSAEVNTANWTA